MLRFALLVLPACLLAAELPAWKAALQPKDQAWQSVEQHFRFNNEAEPATFDPQRATSVNDGRIAMCLFEGLMGYDPVDLSPRPALAEHYDMAQDGLQYTFFLRAAQWSDGQQITAQQFVESWARVIDPAQGLEYSYLFQVIARNHDGSLALSTPNPTTLVVRLARPCPWFLDLCAFPTFFPVRLDSIAQHGEAWTRPGTLVGNGPFVLSEHHPRERLVLSKNPRYWDAEHVRLTRISALPIDDLDTAWRLYQTGEIDWMPTLPAARLASLMRNPDYYAAPFQASYFYRFNCSRPPFNNRLVRQAFSRAINRQAITTHVTQGGEIPLYTLVPPSERYQSPTGLGEDAAAARALLAQAGYGVNHPFPDVELWYNTSENHKRIAEAIAEQWKQNLGVTVKLRNSEWKTFLARQKSVDYDLSRSSWVADYDDPLSFLDCFHSNSGSNRTGWKHPVYDAMLAAAANASDSQERTELYQQLDQLLCVDEAVIIPIYQYVSQGLLRPTVQGLTPNARAVHPLQYLYMEP